MTTKELFDRIRTEFPTVKKISCSENYSFDDGKLRIWLHVDADGVYGSVGDVEKYGEEGIAEMFATLTTQLSPQKQIEAKRARAEAARKDLVRAEEELAKADEAFQRAEASKNAVAADAEQGKGAE